MTPVRQSSEVDALHATYGFGLFPVPIYRPARQGDWSICLHMTSLGDGYLSRAIFEERVVLTKGRQVWMSISLLEKESHAWHVHCAKGVVVVAGLGMGMYAYAVALKPEVEMVVVAEISADIIQLVRASANFDNWPCRDKVRIIQVDALTSAFAKEIEAYTQGKSIDYLYADIWPNFPALEAPSQTAAMASALHPKASGWWGQELSFGNYCHRRQRPVDEESLRAYFSEIGIPVPACSEGYFSFCQDVMAGYGMGPKKTFGQWLKALFSK